MQTPTSGQEKKKGEPSKIAGPQGGVTESGCPEKVTIASNNPPSKKPRKEIEDRRDWTREKGPK